MSVKVLLNRPVTDRVSGKAITFDAGQAVEFPDDLGNSLLERGYGTSGEFPKNAQERDAFANAVKHPSLPPVQNQNKK